MDIDSFIILKRKKRNAIKSSVIDLLLFHNNKYLEKMYNI